MAFAALTCVATAQAAAAELVTLGNEFALSSAPEAISPAVGASARSDGQFVITWGERQGYASPWSLRGRRFDHRATPIDDPFLVAADDDIHYGPMSVAVARDGSFLVTWVTGKGYPYDVAARAFDDAGTPRGDIFAPGADAAAMERRSPSVAPGPSSGFVVVWNETYTSDSGYLGYNTRVAARRVDASGAPIGTQLVVAAGSVPDYVDGGFDAVRAPSAAAAGPGEFVVVWESVDDSYWYGDSSWLASARLPASSFAGSLSSTRFDEEDGQGEHFQGEPRVAGDAFGNTTVVWNAASRCSSGSLDWGSPTGCYYRNDGIGMQRGDVDGEPLPATSPVNVFDNEGQFQPAVAVSPAGDFVVVWTSGPTPEPDKSPKTAPPQDGDETGIFLRAFDCAGAPLSDEDIQVNEWTTGSQWGPSVAVSASGHVLVSWAGGENGAISARAFRIDLPCPLCGDADASGEIRSSDALRALRAGVGLGACSLRRCDVDADGDVSSSDALDILVWSIGGVAKLRCDTSLPDAS